MPRYKDILCNVSNGDDIEFMVDDEQCTVYSDRDFFAIRDEFFKDDLKVAIYNSFEFITIYSPNSFEVEMIPISKYEQNT